MNSDYIDTSTYINTDEIIEYRRYGDYLYYIHILGGKYYVELIKW